MGEHVGDIIRKERVENNLTLADVSKESGLSVSHIASVETGRKKASTGTLRALGNALGIPHVALLEAAGHIESYAYWGGEGAHDLNELLFADGQVSYKGKVLSDKDRQKVKQMLEILFD